MIADSRVVKTEQGRGWNCMQGKLFDGSNLICVDDCWIFWNDAWENRDNTLMLISIFQLLGFVNEECWDQQWKYCKIHLESYVCKHININLYNWSRCWSHYTYWYIHIMVYIYTIMCIVFFTQICFHKICIFQVVSHLRRLHDFLWYIGRGLIFFRFL